MVNYCIVPKVSFHKYIDFKVLDGRLQSLDWTSGLDWWTDIKNPFMLLIHSAAGLHDTSY